MLLTHQNSDDGAVVDPSLSHDLHVRVCGHYGVRESGREYRITTVPTFEILVALLCTSPHY